MKPIERGRTFPGARRAGKGRRILAVLLFVVFLLIAARIALRMREYRAGAAYYDSLRAQVRQ